MIETFFEKRKNPGSLTGAQQRKTQVLGRGRTCMQVVMFMLVLIPLGQCWTEDFIPGGFVRNGKTELRMAARVML